jgi:SOS response regulatory protein OraA/RecX
MKKSQLRQIIKEEISKVLKENSVNEYASEAQQLHYQEIIKNNEWESYEAAWKYLQNEGLEDRMISSILDNAGMDDENENPSY